MPYTTAGTPRLHFETDGDPAAEPLVLIEGLSAQLIGWRMGFVERLVAAGFFVIRLDNRDVGLSDQMAGPDILDIGYTLTDMAGDVCRVLDTLGIAAAHIVGQSLGGAVTQRLAIDFAPRVRSCVLFYTTPAAIAEFVPGAVAEIPTRSPFPSDLTREQAIAIRVAGESTNGTAVYPPDVAWLTELAELSYDRCFRVDGFLRQQSAMVRAGDWRDDLVRIACPVAIIHGRADTIVLAEASLELAALLPQAELHLYPGMGHVVVAPLWDDFVRIIRRTADRARG